MKKRHFEHIESLYFEPNLLTVDDLTDKTPRTLLYGYTADRKTWHVYLEPDTLKIVTVSYKDTDRLRKIHVTYNDDFVPTKRLFPEACDYEFTKLLFHRGVKMPFSNWNPHREHRTFHGAVRQPESSKSSKVRKEGADSHV